MATRADRNRRGRERSDRSVDGLLAGQARLVAIALPHDVNGARSFDELKARTQANFDSMVQQVEFELNRIGKFFGVDGYPVINSDQFFSKSKVGTDT